jgi:hypothetical protein
LRAVAIRSHCAGLAKDALQLESLHQMQGVLELVAGIGVAEGGRMKTMMLMSIVCPLSSVMTCSLKCLIATALQGITNRIAYSKKTAKLTQVKVRVAAVVMTET